MENLGCQQVGCPMRGAEVKQKGKGHTAGHMGKGLGAQPGGGGTAWQSEHGAGCGNLSYLLKWE